MADISGKKVAVLVDNYFEQAEFEGPIKALRDAGATVEVIATEDVHITGMNQDVNKADSFTADRLIDDVQPDRFDALVMPGGTVNADHLRTNPKVHIWVRSFLSSGKVVAAICHAPWALISSGVTKGRHLTSFPSLQDDITNSGATWSDETVVVDDNMITSRKPDDVPAFTEQIIAKLAVTPAS